MKTLIEVQDKIVSQVNAAHMKWANDHGLKKQAVLLAIKTRGIKAIMALGFDDRQALLAVYDAFDMAKLEREAR